MIFIKQLDNIPFTAQSLKFIRRKHQLAAAVLLVASSFAASGVIAGELDDQDQLASTQQLALHLPLSSAAGAQSVEHIQIKPLGLKYSPPTEREAKIQAQTQYLADKFNQSELVIREFVELAWEEASKRTRMTPELLIAMMQKESSLRPKVQSRYGAQGLMQVVRRWHTDKLHPSESLFDPEVNIRVGADVLEEYLDSAGGSLSTALRKYSGNAQGYANKVLSESHKLARVAAEAAGQVVAAKG